jgi:hypothetical protein
MSLWLLLAVGFFIVTYCEFQTAWITDHEMTNTRRSILFPNVYPSCKHSDNRTKDLIANCLWGREMFMFTLKAIIILQQVCGTWPIYHTPPCQYTTAKGCLQALCVALRFRTALSRGILVIYHTSPCQYRICSMACPTGFITTTCIHIITVLCL